MKYCKYCGAPLWPDGLYCTECGKKIEFEEPAGAVEESEKAVPVQEVPVHEEKKEPEEKPKKGWLKFVVAAVFAAFLCGIGGWFFANGRSGNNTLAGKWQAVDGQLLTIELEKDGTGLIDNPSLGLEQNITWTADGTELVITLPVYGSSSAYEYKLDGDTLTIISETNPDDGAIVLSRK